MDQLDLLAEHVDASNYSRTCLYLTSTSSYLPQPDDRTVLVKVRAPSALRSARLPVNLIGSPINYANRLIGSPVSS